MKTLILLLFILMPYEILSQTKPQKTTQIVNVLDNVLERDKMYVFNTSLSLNTQTNRWSFDKNLIRLHVNESDNKIFITDIYGATIKEFKINESYSTFYPEEKRTGNVAYFMDKKYGHKWKTVDNYGSFYEFSYVDKTMSVAYYIDKEKKYFVRTYYMYLENLPL